jgi:hypothetical protein
MGMKAAAGADRDVSIVIVKAPARADAKNVHRFFALILLSFLDERRIQMSDGITS